MSNTTALLDKALKLCQPATHYRLAKTLGIKHTTISRCYLHGGTLDNEAAFRLAKMLRMPVADVIAYMEEDRARNDKKREFWRQQLPRVLPAIATGTGLLLALGAALIAGHHGVGTDTTNLTSGFTPLYIMRISISGDGRRKTSGRRRPPIGSTDWPWPY